MGALADVFGAGGAGACGGGVSVSLSTNLLFFGAAQSPVLVFRQPESGASAVVGYAGFDFGVSGYAQLLCADAPCRAGGGADGGVVGGGKMGLWGIFAPFS